MTADRLVLWRHGRTAWNATGRFQGQTDVPLDDVGRVQVKDAAEMLAERLAGRRCRIVSSDLSRAHATAQAFTDLVGGSITLDPLLREVHGGRWQGLLRSEIEQEDATVFAAWRDGADAVAGATGERRSEAGRRTEAAVRAHAAPMDGGVLVVASHGAALRGAVQSLIGLAGWSADLFGGLRNAHWIDLSRRGEGWVLDAYNVGPVRGSVGAEG